MFVDCVVQAEQFHRLWVSPGAVAKDKLRRYAQIRRGDSRKGLERIGRYVFFLMYGLVCIDFECIRGTERLCAIQIDIFISACLQHLAILLLLLLFRLCNNHLALLFICTAVACNCIGHCGNSVFMYNKNSNRHC